MAAPEGGSGAPHRPVLLDETIALLQPEEGGLFVDGTLGLGGHSEAILMASPATSVIGIDRDRQALRWATKRLARFGTRFRPAHANFREIGQVLEAEGVERVRGVLVDLGVSSLQFDTEARGFSFRHDAPLDMRMDSEGDDETAAELLERLPEEEIARIVYEYGEERHSRRIARWIVERRERGEPISNTKELADLVARAVKSGKRDRIHPATRTFQALRIAVNRELEGL
ncbi:MAG TPA: 16S rRNA (cytosine(1402)-N(4))-methyltransferase RsmH, partial [Pyrinomonadaceae bacterium]